MKHYLRFAFEYKMVVHLAAAGDVFDGVLFCAVLLPRDVLDKIWD